MNTKVASRRIQLSNLFSRLTDKKEPYEFQLDVAEAILDGFNVVLSAPTGSGKTLAALLPFLFSKETEATFVDRLIYALPLRTLASSLFVDTVKMCEKNLAVNVKTTINDRCFDDMDLYLTIQTGEQQDDPFLQGDIIFTTIDQLLSAYLMQPVSLSPRLANLNAGALVGSLIIFDEVHLLEPDKAMGTAIEMMAGLNKLTQFMMMTATLCPGTRTWLADKLNAKVINISANELDKLEKLWGRERRWVFLEDALCADAVLKLHKQRTLVICNTVRKAQVLANDLKEANNKSELPIVLHSRFLPKDRRLNENRVIEAFGKNSQSSLRNVIAVTTQVIEAGMDMSADLVITELANANSLVQRAGRCARYGGFGQVVVCNLSHEDWSLTARNHYPYESNLLKRTAEILMETCDKTMGTKQEEAFVDNVHGNFELAELNKINFYSRRTEMANAIDGDRAQLRYLVRDIRSLNVIVAANPENIAFDKSKWPATIGLSPYSLFRLSKRVESDVWAMKIPVYRDMFGEDEATVNQFTWKEISDPNQATWLVAVNPALASYSAKLGLEIGKAGQSIVEYDSLPAQLRYGYSCESFEKHAERTRLAIQRLLKKQSASLEALGNLYSIDRGKLHLAMMVIAGLHDVGKLSTKWQRIANSWQRHKSPNMIIPKALAHTAYEPAKDFLEKRRYPFPVHAAEGAYALIPIITDVFYQMGASERNAFELARVAVTAISRHHQAHHHSGVSDFSLIPEAKEIVGDCLESLALSTDKSMSDKPSILVRGKHGDFAKELLNAEDGRKFLPLYSFIARNLRLADQLATAASQGR